MVKRKLNPPRSGFRRIAWRSGDVTIEVDESSLHPAPETTRHPEFDGCEFFCGSCTLCRLLAAQRARQRSVRQEKAR